MTRFKILHQELRDDLEDDVNKFISDLPPGSVINDINYISKNHPLGDFECTIVFSIPDDPMSRQMLMERRGGHKSNGS